MGIIYVSSNIGNLTAESEILINKDENGRNKKNLSQHQNKNSKNKRIFEVLWTVDAVLRLLESHYCILRWIK
jgi:hypothetical protein